MRWKVIMIASASANQSKTRCTRAPQVSTQRKWLSSRWDTSLTSAIIRSSRWQYIHWHWPRRHLCICWLIRRQSREVHSRPRSWRSRRSRRRIRNCSRLSWRRRKGRTSKNQSRSSLPREEMIRDSVRSQRWRRQELPSKKKESLWRSSRNGERRMPAVAASNCLRETQPSSRSEFIWTSIGWKLHCNICI